MLYSQVKEAIKQSDKETVRKVLNEQGEDILIAALDCGVNPADIEEAYQGKYRDDEDFAQETADSLGRLPEDNMWPYYCIDWEWAARELMMDYSESNGHYFRNI